MKEKKSEAPRRGNEELFKWDGNPTFGQILPLAAQHVLAAVVGCVTPAILVANAANNLQHYQHSFSCMEIRSILDPDFRSSSV